MSAISTQLTGELQEDCRRGKEGTWRVSDSDQQRWYTNGTAFSPRTVSRTTSGYVQHEYLLHVLYHQSMPFPSQTRSFHCQLRIYQSLCWTPQTP
jgi:hypothetical protein